MRIIVLVLLLALPYSAVAGPIDWIKHHKRFLAMEVVNAGALVVASYGVHHCRRGDVEHCFEGYGASTQGLVMDSVLSMVVFPTIAEAGWRAEWNSFGYTVGYAPAAVNIGLGIQQYHAYSPEVAGAHEAAKRYQPR